jgi:general secretion pathway protein G
MVVAAILVILAGVGGVIYMRQLEDSKQSTAKAQSKLLSEAVSMYQLKYGDYPPSLESLTQPTADGGKPFLETSALIDPWGHPYLYAVPGPHHPSTGGPDIWSQGDGSGQWGNW